LSSVVSWKLKRLQNAIDERALVGRKKKDEVVKFSCVKIVFYYLNPNESQSANKIRLEVFVNLLGLQYWLDRLRFFRRKYYHIMYLNWNWIKWKVEIIKRFFIVTEVETLE
jgi:hypothetical protein